MTFHAVNNPAHYTRGRKYEPIEVLEEYFGSEPLLWQVGKYLSRYGRKSEGVADIEKALFYLNRFRHLYVAARGKPTYHFRISDVISDWYDDTNSNIALAMEYLLASVTTNSPEIRADHLGTVEMFLQAEITEKSHDTVLQTVDTSLAIGESDVITSEPQKVFSFALYQHEAAQTIVYPRALTLLYPALGLCGEAGEVAEKVKKLYRDHDGLMTEEFVVSVKKELGDVLWYITALCRDLGITLQSVAETNLEKLADRHKRNVIRGNGDDR